jgi:hypothetical protein
VVLAPAVALIAPRDRLPHLVAGAAITGVLATQDAVWLALGVAALTYGAVYAGAESAVPKVSAGTGGLQ